MAFLAITHVRIFVGLSEIGGRIKISGGSHDTDWAYSTSGKNCRSRDNSRVK